MHKKTVMFVDDDLSFLSFMQQVCKKIEIIGLVLIARDGEEGLALIQKSLEGKEVLPDSIFVDINMPRLDGFGFLSGFNLLKEKFPGKLDAIKPIAVLTSSDQEKDIKRAKVLGADSYIIKSSSVKEARDLLSKLIQ